MPPRYAYWTILVDEQPTAFRAALQEELQPTFKRLKEKHPSARMVWFQNGKVWNSRIEAQEAMRARGEMGRRGDSRQGGGFRSPPGPPPVERRDASGKLEWKPKGRDSGSDRPARRDRPIGRGDRPSFSAEKQGGSKREGSFAKRPSKPFVSGDRKPEWKPKSFGARPKSFGARPKADWKPKGEYSARPKWQPKNSGPAPASRGPRSSGKAEGWREARPERRDQKLEWKPKGAAAPAAPEKRKWVPKETYQRQAPRGAKPAGGRRDKTWRPGGDHKDPRQKYKDAKKAKWTRFKQNVRKGWEKKQGRKKKDDE